MQSYLKYIFIFFVFISLSACSDSAAIKAAKDQTEILQGIAAKLKLLNDDCRLQLADVLSRLEIVKGNYTKEVLAEESLSREAAIANACKKPFDINVCPESMTKAGENAILQGISGGNSPIFWTVYTMKIFFILFVLVLPFALIVDFLSRRIKPNLEAFSKAEKAVLSAQEKLIACENDIQTKQQESASVAANILEKEKSLNSVIKQHKKAIFEYERYVHNFNENKHFAAEQEKYIAEKALAISSFARPVASPGRKSDSPTVRGTGMPET